MLPYTLSAALVPAILLLLYFHQRDVNREPAKVLWVTFGLGVLVLIPILGIEMFISGILLDVDRISDVNLAGLAKAFCYAAIPEELLKFLVLYFYAARNKAFDEPMDGIVYGVAASLGFAAMENVLYVANGGLSVAYMRAITAVPAHAVFGAIMGYYVGQMKCNPQRSKAWTLLMALFWPIFLHGLYDYPLFAVQIANARDGKVSLGQSLVLILAAGVVIGGLVWAYKAAKKLAYAQKWGYRKEGEKPSDS